VTLLVPVSRGAPPSGIWIDLNRYRRGCKAGARQRTGCCFSIQHEMADVIEKNLLGARELPIDPGLRLFCQSLWRAIFTAS
jgi:hypothetical protein